MIRIALAKPSANLVKIVNLYTVWFMVLISEFMVHTSLADIARPIHLLLGA